MTTIPEIYAGALAWQVFPVESDDELSPEHEGATDYCADGDGLFVVRALARKFDFDGYQVFEILWQGENDGTFTAPDLQSALVRAALILRATSRDLYEFVATAPSDAVDTAMVRAEFHRIEQNPRHAEHQFSLWLAHRNRSQQTEIQMTYCLSNGFQVSTTEQARTMLMVAMLKGDFALSEECRRILKALELQGQ